jgi:hypothetical protein
VRAIEAAVDPPPQRVRPWLAQTGHGQGNWWRDGFGPQPPPR